MRTGVVLHAVAMALTLTACATSFVAERVDPRASDLSSSAGGIYYALPKTAIDISMPVHVTSAAGGEMGAVFADCALACAASEQARCEIPKPAAMQLGVQRVDVMARAKADLTNVYRVTVTPGLWQTIEHEFVLDDLGILTEGSSSGQNNAGTVVTTIAAQAVQLALGLTRTDVQIDPSASTATGTAGTGLSTWSLSAPAAGALAAAAEARKARPQRPAQPPPQLARNGPKTGCDAVASYPEAWFGPRQQKWNVARYLGQRTFTDTFGAKDKPLVCEELRCIQQALEQLDEQITGSQAAITAKLADIAAGGGNGDAAIAYRDSAQFPAARLQEARLAMNAALHMDSTQKTFGLVFRFKQPLEPEPFAATGPGSCAAPNAVVLLKGNPPDLFESANGQWCAMALAADGPADAASEDVDAAADEVKRRIAVFMQVVPETYNGAPAPAQAAVQAGYRYRLPASGAVRVLAAKPKMGADSAALCAAAPERCAWTRMLSTTLAIAQYGPVVALPSKFDGNAAQLKFSLNSVGALKSIKLGQTARSASDATDPLKTVGTALQDLRDRKRQAEKDAADATKAAPLNTLKDQNALAQEQIDKLKKDLCLKALQTPPADGSLPAVCG